MKRIALLAAAGLLAAACDRPEPFVPEIDSAPRQPIGRLAPAFSTGVTHDWSAAILPLPDGTPLPHSAKTLGAAINENGWVAGTTYATPRGFSWDWVRATLWKPDGSVQELGVLPPYNSTQRTEAKAINDHGAIVGEATGLSSNGLCCVNHAFLWTAEEGLRSLPTLTSLPSAYARASGINNQGHIVGHATDDTGALRAVIWTDPTQPPTPIGSFHNAWVMGINDHDQVIGAGSQGTFVWSPVGGVQMLGPIPGGGSLWPVAINNAGHVVGIGFRDDGDVRAILWTPQAGMQDLGLPPGAVHAAARGITDAGHIVAEAQYADEHTHWTRAFLWFGGAWFPLDEDDMSGTPGSISITAPAGINEKLQVTGYGTVALTGDRALLWNVTLTPITPEPPRFTFDGFFAPIANLPTVNRVKAGQAIPVKFSLGGDHGLNIFAAGFPASQPIACNGSAPSEAIEATGTAGASSLSFDPIAGQYVYVWKTERSWGGSCRRLTVRLTDGTERSADFQFLR